MRSIDLSFEIAAPPARFWSLYLDESFNRESFIAGLGWAAPTILGYRSNDDEVIREQSAQPQLQLPPKLAKLVGERLGYHEHGRFDRAAGLFEFRQRTTMFKDKLRIEGKMHGDARDAGMTLHAKIEVECSVFGLSGLIERSVEQNVLESFAALVRHWNQWLQDHPA